MKVNEGTIKFTEFKDGDNNGPNRKWSIEDLIRCALERQIEPDSTGKRNYVFKNTSSWTIENQINQIFLKTDKNRKVRSDFVDEGEFEFNPFSDYQSDLADRKAFFASVDDENKQVESLMNVISLIIDTDWKKSLIIWFMKNATHLKAKNSFKLRTKFSKNEVEDLPEETVNNMIQANTEINEVIKEFQDNYDNNVGELTDTFINDVLDLIKLDEDKRKVETLLNAHLFNIMNEDNISNTKKHLFTESWISDITGDYLINDKIFPRFNKILVSYRENFRNLININLKVGAKKFNITGGENGYRRRIPKALNYIQEYYSEL